jgi:hypothetical protein
MRVLTAVLMLATLFGYRAVGQQVASPVPQLQIFVDTAGVSTFAAMEEDSAGHKVVTEHPGVYMTWVFAKATATSLPSSGVLVAFDCRGRKVKRLAHVVYRLSADRQNVEGAIEVDDREWQEPTIPRMMDMVCRIGPTHAPAVVAPTPPIDGFRAPGVAPEPETPVKVS